MAPKIQRTEAVSFTGKQNLVSTPKKRLLNYDFAAAFAGVQHVNLPRGIESTVFGGQGSEHEASHRATNH